MATVVRVVHGAGLFFRPGGLHASKIIVPSKGRLRISGVGILDVLHGDPADDPRVFQVDSGDLDLYIVRSRKVVVIFNLYTILEVTSC